MSPSIGFAMCVSMRSIRFPSSSVAVTVYLSRARNAIRSARGDGTQPQIVFDIRRDGKITGLAVEKTSGNPLYDQAAMRAITDATPFPPLPDDFKESFLRVHLGFSYSGTRG